MQNAVLTHAKRSANSCKMQCYLMQNARLSHTKRKAKCSKK